jgi:dihydroflavonol-4-reductase
MTRALVTGATGFLGRHLTRLLIESGHEVVALVKEEKPDAEFIALGARIEPGDVLDRASVERAAAGAEVLFHCAGKVSRDPKDAELLHRLHVDGTMATLDAARSKGIRRAIVASTSGVVAVSASTEPTNEDGKAPIELIGKWPYYRSKLYAEMAAFDRNGPEFEVTAINPALLLGPGDLTGSSTGDVVDIIEGRVPVVPLGGLSFVDARDAAIGMVLAWQKGRAGRRYLLAGQNLTLRAFADKVARIAEVSPPKAELPKNRFFETIGADVSKRLHKHIPGIPAMERASAEMAQAYWYVDATRAKEELGWAPRDPMETLVDTITDLKTRGIVWPQVSDR